MILNYIRRPINFILSTSYILMPRRFKKRVNETIYFPDKKSIFQKIIIKAFESYYYKTSESNRRKINESGFWANSAGYHWHLSKLNDPEYLQNMLSVRENLSQSIANVLRVESKIQTVLEIGTGNGYYLDHIRTLSPETIRFVGLDINEPIISHNNTYYNQTMHFACVEADKYIESESSEGMLIMSGGSLLCLTPRELEELLRSIKSKESRCVLCICESTMKRFEAEETYKTLKNTAYAHNYIGMLKKLGFKLQLVHSDSVGQAMVKQTIIAYN